MALNLVVAVLDRGPARLADMAVLLAIVDSADRDTGEAWPSHRTIAARSRQTDRNVRKVLDRLREEGWLTWEPRKREGGSQTSNLYTVNLAKLGETPRNHVPPPRNDVPPSPGTTVRPPPEPRSAHAPEPRSALEPSQKKEPLRAGVRPGRKGAHRVPPRADGGAGNEAPTLTAFQRSRVLGGQSVTVGGVLILPGSPEAEALRQALRGQHAESGVSA